MQDLMTKISYFEANLGGTEIYEPMRYELGKEQITGYPKNIFLITDGQVYNEDAIVNLVK